ncbi:hypothetical protein SAMN02910344_02030 [Ruminobacter amylophilus]|uniref:Uncharacterized protein n=1 Tax=Ruminobacter amylophilus TaxID=867 RepID=A0A662ZJR8_9GAMM|nr:hypothetical protein [Ruminobacter amylophilus]SFP67399.1 hypothetical protein SAMN02910344_02030 [Ruminobacter amylophilus]
MFDKNIKGWVSNSIDDGKIIGWLINIKSSEPRIAIIKINDSYSKEIMCNQKRSNPKRYTKHLNNGFKIFLDAQFLGALSKENHIELIDKATNKVVAKSIVNISQEELKRLETELNKNISDYNLINNSGYFNSLYYRLHTPSLWFNKKEEVLNHFLKIGWLQGKNPSFLFNTKAYLENNPNIKNEHINPLVHFLKNEKKSEVIAAKNNGYLQRLKNALKYPIRVKREYKNLLAEIKSLNNLKK